MNIDLRIEELILEGFPAAYRGRIAEVIQRELTQIFTDRGIPPGWSQNKDLGKLDGGSFNFSPGASVEAVGTQVAGTIAKNIYGGSSR
jgi:hypothetical protein